MYHNYVINNDVVEEKAVERLTFQVIIFCITQHMMSMGMCCKKHDISTERFDDIIKNGFEIVLSMVEVVNINNFLKEIERSAWNQIVFKKLYNMTWNKKTFYKFRKHIYNYVQIDKALSSSVGILELMLEAFHTYL